MLLLLLSIVGVGSIVGKVGRIVGNVGGDGVSDPVSIFISNHYWMNIFKIWCFLSAIDTGSVADL